MKPPKIIRRLNYLNENYYAIWAFDTWDESCESDEGGRKYSDRYSWRLSQQQERADTISMLLYNLERGFTLGSISEEYENRVKIWDKQDLYWFNENFPDEPFPTCPINIQELVAHK
jgi:hypothetical protein